jgi:Family of unknown function (DUF6134)
MSMRCIAVVASIAAAISIRPAAAATQEWHFEVSADGRHIGTHTFKVVDDAEQRTVETTASFEAKVMLVPFYRYHHHDQELWKAGCLQQIQADTNDNGKGTQVQGQAGADGLRIDSGPLLPGCVTTFAYWDKRFMEQSHVLNSQTGEYLEIDFRRVGLEQITVRGQKVEAEHYIVMTPKFSIDLWYSRSAEWLALESLTENKHVLRYERQ